MRMRKKKNNLHDCECDKPEIRDSFESGNCSEEQIRECHGQDFLKSLKENEKI